MQKGAGMDRLRATGTENHPTQASTRCWTRIGLSSLIIALCIAGLASTAPSDLRAATCSARPADPTICPGLLESHLQELESTPKSYRVRTGGYETTTGR